MFDLKKYLANNPLLNEGLSKQEKMVVDDIMSVTEGAKDVYNKLVSYGKKGMMSLAIIASVLTSCAEQGDMDSAKATIEYAVSNDWSGSDQEKLGITAIGLINKDDLQHYSRSDAEQENYDFSIRSNAEFEEEKQEMLFNEASDYFYNLIKGDTPQSAKSKIKGVGSWYSKEEALDYIQSIEDKITSNSSLANKIFQEELTYLVKSEEKGGVDPRTGELNKLWLRTLDKSWNQPKK